MSRALSDRVKASANWTLTAGCKSLSGYRLQAGGSWIGADGECVGVCPGDDAPDLTDAATVGILREQASGPDDIAALVTELER